jgi:alpha-tubulin suppressor-like RCC1 family protein
MRIRSVSSGFHHGCAVTQAGEVYTWGRGEHGCLGHREFASEPLPRRVEELWQNGIVVVGASAGAAHTLVASNDGRVYGVGTPGGIGATAISEDLDKESDFLEELDEEDDTLESLNEDDISEPDEDSDSGGSNPRSWRLCFSHWQPVGFSGFKVSLPR